jgi:hypothetical protein
VIKNIKNATQSLQRKIDQLTIWSIREKSINCRFDCLEETWSIDDLIVQRKNDQLTIWLTPQVARYGTQRANVIYSICSFRHREAVRSCWARLIKKIRILKIALHILA